MFLNLRQTKAYLESGYWCRPYPHNPYKRECKVCGRMETSDEKIDYVRDEDAWIGGPVMRGQCSWHRESTLTLIDGKTV